MGSQEQLTRQLGLSAPETMPEAVMDDEGVVGIDIAPTNDGLEAGIAAVFEAIRSGDGEDGDTSEDSDEAPVDDGITFALLTELNRLWDRAPA